MFYEKIKTLHKSRMNLLKRAYHCAQTAGTLRVGYCIERREFLQDRFNYEYLEQKGYIKITKKGSQFIITIQADGIDIVEDSASTKALAYELSKFDTEKMMKI